MLVYVIPTSSNRPDRTRTHGAAQHVKFLHGASVKQRNENRRLAQNLCCLRLEGIEPSKKQIHPTRRLLFGGGRGEDSVFNGDGREPQLKDAEVRIRHRAPCPRAPGLASWDSRGSYTLCANRSHNFWFCALSSHKSKQETVPA